MPRSGEMSDDDNDSSPPGALLFVNKNASSAALSQSQGGERFRIQSHVQTNRRREQGRQRTPKTDQPSRARTIITEGSSSRGQSRHVLLPGPARVIFPSHNGSDPFHCTVAGADIQPRHHAMLFLTFTDVARMTFLAEAFATPSVMRRRATTRHDRASRERLRRCIERPALLYSSLAYASRCLGWAADVVDGGGGDGPPEYFIDKALRATRMHLMAAGAGGAGEVSGGGNVDTWSLFSIYSLAITELWNGEPLMWSRSPATRGAARERARAGDQADRRLQASLEACRIHLSALLDLVEGAGGWNRFDPYLMESAILGDKYLAVVARCPPIMDNARWDPGRLPPETMRELATTAEGLLQVLGTRIVRADVVDPELRRIVEDVVDYVRVAERYWAGAGSAAGLELESWLFLRLQSLIYRLMGLGPRGLEPLGEALRLSVLIFLLSGTQYHGSQAAARAVAGDLSLMLADYQAIVAVADEYPQALGLWFWCACTSAMATMASPAERGLFVHTAALLRPVLFPGWSKDALRRELEAHLMLPSKDVDQIFALVSLYHESGENMMI